MAGKFYPGGLSDARLALAWMVRGVDPDFSEDDTGGGIDAMLWAQGVDLDRRERSEIRIEPPKPLEELRQDPAAFADWLLDAFITPGVLGDEILWNQIADMRRETLEGLCQEAEEKLQFELQALGVELPGVRLQLRFYGRPGRPPSLRFAVVTDGDKRVLRYDR